MRKLKKCDRPCAIALGNFDGLHRAHMKIINSCVEYSRNAGMLSGVLLFDRHTSELFGNGVKLLTTMEEKLEILEEAGVEFVYIMHFDEVVAKTESKKFIEKILADFKVDAFFVGYDYSFGKGAEGTAEILREYGEELGFKTFVTGCVKEKDRIISSTAVRELIEIGETEEASKLLGRRYFIKGKVLRGFGNGTKSLFPTANVEIKDNKFLPPDGVYKGITVIDGKRYKSAVNIGKNPTFNAKKRTVESFILDFDGEIYGEIIRVEFLEKIRSDKKFDSVEALKRQIESDIENVREIEL